MAVSIYRPRQRFARSQNFQEHAWQSTLLIGTPACTDVTLPVRTDIEDID